MEPLTELPEASHQAKPSRRDKSARSCFNVGLRRSCFTFDHQTGSKDVRLDATAHQASVSNSLPPGGGELCSATRDHLESPTNNLETCNIHVDKMMVGMIRFDNTQARRSHDATRSRHA